MRNFAIPLALLASFISGALSQNTAFASSAHNQAWRDTNRALVLDAYEFNSLDWHEIITDKRIVGFIGKASDGLTEPYRCTGNVDERALCKVKWRRYFVTRELYQTRRHLAKALGLKWGAYHLARPDNPIAQADHFLEFADPSDGELIALDIEGIDADKWMSLKDAEVFARRIHQKLGRYPMLYVNGSTAKHIAHYSDKYPLLSRLSLWYARFSPNIEGHFPKGNWDSYDLWQFAANINCSKRRCPYRPAGTPIDIDVNVADMTVEELRAAWPLGKLKDVKPSDNTDDHDDNQMLMVEAKPDVKEVVNSASLALIPLPFSAPRDDEAIVQKVAFVTALDWTKQILPATLFAAYREKGDSKLVAKRKEAKAASKTMLRSLYGARTVAPKAASPMIIVKGPNPKPELDMTMTGSVELSYPAPQPTISLYE